MLRIGYACINTMLPTSNRTCRLRNATAERVVALGRQNLQALLEILEWNRVHGIALFRISSGVIPLASHPIVGHPKMGVRWWEELGPELAQVGAFIRKHGMRVSMHPGQFTVINSLRTTVVGASFAELEYHARFLDALGLDGQHKLVLHLGGVFGDKAGAKQRFVERYHLLPEMVRRRLVLENDERSYSLGDVMEVAGQTGAPVVFDVFHHRWNPSLEGLSLREQVELAAGTWRSEDGRPKLHYSDQWLGKPPGSHSQTVDVEAFGRFAQQVHDLELDVMLEVKDKEQSVMTLYEAIPQLKE